jgi:hypothetical protein
MNMNEWNEWIWMNEMNEYEVFALI